MTSAEADVLSIYSVLDEITSPEELIYNLQKFVAKKENERVPASEKGSWLSFLDTLSLNFIQGFPDSRFSSWDTLEEKRRLCLITLEAIKWTTNHVDEIFTDSDNRSLIILWRVLNLLVTLNTWTTPFSLYTSDENTPSSLRRKVTEVLRRVIRGFTYGLLDSEVCEYIMEKSISTANYLLDNLSEDGWPEQCAFIDLTPLFQPVDTGYVVDSEILSVSEFFLTLSSALRVAAICLEARKNTSSAPSYGSREIVATARSVLEILVSSDITKAFSPQRIEALVSLIQSVRIIFSPTLAGDNMLSSIVTILLIYRLRVGPRADWRPIDETLLDLCRNKPINLYPESSCLLLLELLLQEDIEEVGELIIDASYLAVLSTIKTLGPRTVKAMRALLEKKEPEPRIQALLDAIGTVDLHKRHGPNLEIGVEDFRENTVNLDLRKRTIEFVRERMSALDKFEVPEDDLSDSDYFMALLEQLYLDAIGQGYGASIEARIGFTNALKELACTLAHPGNNICSSSTTTDQPSLNILDAYTVQLAQVTMHPNHEPHDVPVHEMNNSLFRAIQDAWIACFRHNTGKDFHDGTLAEIVYMLRSDIIDDNRSKRLASGRALVEFVGLLQRVGRAGANDWPLTELCHMLEQILEKEKTPVRETALITIGLLGKIAHRELQGKCVVWLFEALGQTNIFLKSLAYMQLVQLSEFHERTPYQLVSAYLREISIYVVSLLPKNPDPIMEACRFLSKSTTEFLNMTSKYFLPKLFANRDVESLHYINKTLGASVSSLYLDSAAEVLAHIFLLEDVDDCDKALTFLVETLKSGNASSEINLVVVVRSSINLLLAKLVIAMGNSESDNSEINSITRAKEALLRVENCLASPRDTKVDPRLDLEQFLKKNLMGIVTTLIDLLQDAYGHQNDEEKRSVMLGLDALIKEVGRYINTAAPQVMATLQSTVYMPSLSSTALQTWHSFLTSLSPRNLGPHVGPTTAVIVKVWPSLDLRGKNIATQSIKYLLNDVFLELGDHVEDIVDISIIPELKVYGDRILTLRGKATASERLDSILNHVLSSNSVVAEHALGDLRSFMLTEYPGFIHDLTSGDTFDPLVGQIIRVLLSVLRRDGENAEKLRLLSYQCIGILGAADPDRFDFPYKEDNMIVLYNYTDEEESMKFAMHLIADTLVGVYRSTSDMAYQNQLAYAIQELMKFCQFKPELAAQNRPPLPLKVLSRWNSMPKHVLETVTPLLGGRFILNSPDFKSAPEHPIYLHQETYREWIQSWTDFLITRVKGEKAIAIFDVLRLAVRNKDVSVAHELLPHLVLHNLISGDESDVQRIRSEFVVVLEDQAAGSSTSSLDKRVLSAQAVFMLMDHLNNWIRIKRQVLNSKKSSRSRPRSDMVLNETQLEVAKVDSILASIDQVLVAKAAFQCRAYARSLMNFEKQIISVGKENSDKVQVYYEKLHEIYAHLDEPDGMEGVSKLITFPSIEHQIRQHESTGRWTSAQSCWEVRLQQSPDELDYHLGLLRCLRNLGHYDSLRTHIQGVLVRNPSWESALAGYSVEGAWMNGDWNSVQELVNKHRGSNTWELEIAELLLAFRSTDDSKFEETIASVRRKLGAPIFAIGGRGGYRRAYDAVLKLHLVQDIEFIRVAVSNVHQGFAKARVLPELFSTLSRRLESTLPTFKAREPLLSVIRATYSLSQVATTYFKRAIGKAWLESAKLSRKAGHLQTAYSAVLQAEGCRAPFPFYQKAKIVKASGEPLRALHELENALKLSDERRLSLSNGVLDLTEDIQVDADEQKRIEAKAKLLCTRWKDESDRFDASTIAKEFMEHVKEFSEIESCHFHSGHFQDEYFKSLNLSPENEKDWKNRGAKMGHYTIKAYLRASMFGSKYTYQMIPRLLTIWLDSGEDAVISKGPTFKHMNEEIERAITTIPVYKWMTSFPQIVSRVGHSNQRVLATLQTLIATIILEYPQQALWLFMSAVKSTNETRRRRGTEILDRVKRSPRSQDSKVPELVKCSMKMTSELLRLCDLRIQDQSTRTFRLKHALPGLLNLTPSPLIIPLQESMTVSLPPSSSSESTHQPFPTDAPTIQEFFDDVDVMKSLARPRKITLLGSDGQQYTFLGKPKDDLRKDARLMEFNSIINKLLKTNSESRRRQLRIRTYSVVTLNEECGFLQWVPNTKPIRPILLQYYGSKGIESWSNPISKFFADVRKIRDDKDAKEQFEQQVLARMPSVFHEWFLDTFPEPTAWLASRHAYGRTAAVMSMVGFILGLGDRHLENILMDVTTGDVVHVDFNCLFEKGKLLEVPERVPFRLTHNMVDALGVTGVEGVFRIASEISLQLLRDNKDILMTVLDTFIHDPLVEWLDDQRKQQLMREQAAKRKGQLYIPKETDNLRQLGRSALEAIEKKLKGLYSRDLNRPTAIKQVETSNLVQILIEEATDSKNLCRMYPGWAPMH